MSKSMIAFFSIILLGATAFQQAQAQTTVGVVDIKLIMRDSKAANDIRAQVKETRRNFQNELDAKEKQLQQEDQELAKQRNVLSQEAFQQKYTEFRKKAANAQKEIRLKRTKLDRGFNSALQQVQEKVTDIVEDIAKQQGYDVVISGAPVLYFGDSQDITGQVLQELDRQMPSLTVEFDS